MTCRLGEPEGTQVLPDDDNDSDCDVYHGGVDVDTFSLYSGFAESMIRYCVQPILWPP